MSEESSKKDGVMVNARAQAKVTGLSLFMALIIGVIYAICQDIFGLNPWIAAAIAAGCGIVYAAAVVRPATKKMFINKNQASDDNH